MSSGKQPIPGQAVEFATDDDTPHNVHVMGRANPEWNLSMSARSGPITKVFDEPEVMVPVRCNVHPWMRAYIGVVDNPYFTVTGADGSFAIANVPPGTYTLGVWQEKLGEQDIEVKLAPRQSRTVAFKFRE